MEIGIDSFVSTQWTHDSPSGDAKRIAELLEEIEMADKVGLDVYAIGEHHREEYLASAPTILLAAAAARTKNIRLASAVTVLSSDDPIRVYQQFATIDLISNGRAEIMVGRGSFIESYPLFGFDLKDYETLFAEKLDLLLTVRDEINVHWSGTHRAPLKGEGVYPRPVQSPLPVIIGVGGTPQSFARAGALGLPLIVAIIGGEPHRFRPLIDLYREAGRRAGHSPDKLWVGVHVHGFVAETTEKAADILWPEYQRTFNKIGAERGWGPTTRGSFDAQRGPLGALLVGDPETVAAKMLHIDESLGGVKRITMLLNGSTLTHENALRHIELLGTEVKPRVNGLM
ncbi:LLM class flavin-dependent oxidoreductase [Oryzibacter oryziterrae]|uniref:LLM class flavin-dependent oxidoreductase n=1 Tax=Oryzibacter oryziterrae TaxID=2766474 RepID=UPI001F2A76D3|nr:LLM class flavin-dependent oxidoreductase [Oryzibacter oryziterrae]